MTHRLCPSCSVAAANADSSHLSGDDLVTVTHWLESVGLIVHVGQAEEPGYWDCAACGWTQIGDPAELWEPVT